MKKEYTVYYRLNPTAHTMTKPEPPKNLGEFKSEFIEVVKIMAESIDDAWGMMQGDFWSPRGEATKHIERLGLTHTSMSVGDIIRDQYGNYYLCLAVGWKPFDMAPEENPWTVPSGRWE